MNNNIEKDKTKMKAKVINLN